MTVEIDAFDLGFEHAFHAGPKTDFEARIVANLSEEDLARYQHGLRNGMAAKTPIRLVTNDSSTS